MKSNTLNGYSEISTLNSKTDLEGPNMYYEKSLGVIYFI